MEPHELQAGAAAPGRKSSGNTSMIIAAFGFLVLMLVLTAPAAGPGPAPVMDHDLGYTPASTTAPSGFPPPVLPVAGYAPAPDPVMARVQIMTGQLPAPASGTALPFY